ncbi:uncharacterized protein [Dermacentor andersoni]|uniref:uncharacterized protein n=1 Tax=Dermacentor andersoni TaxID=34620 RepID=UPI002417129F|nr:uncharacterized protein LOC129381432 [Dermacentor andersoni]
MSKRRLSGSQGRNEEQSPPPGKQLSTRTAESPLVSKRSRHEAGCSSASTPSEGSAKRLCSEQEVGSDKPKTPRTWLLSKAAESRLPGWISERDWREAGSSSGSSRNSFERLDPGNKPSDTARTQRGMDTAPGAASGIHRPRRSHENDASRRSQAEAVRSMRNVEPAAEEDQVVPNVVIYEDEDDQLVVGEQLVPTATPDVAAA